MALRQMSESCIIDLLRNYILISKVHIPAMRLKRRANPFLLFLHRFARIRRRLIRRLWVVFYFNLNSQEV